MTDREAMKLALDALVEVKGWQSLAPGYVSDEVEDAIIALRQAIQEAALQKLTDIHQEIEAEKQEPVAWWNPDESGLSFKQLRGDWQPLYAAPVHTIAISQERVDETGKNKHEPNVYGDGNVYRGVRSKDSETKTLYCKAGECDWCMLEATQESLREHMAEIKRLRAELEQAEKVEPVACPYCKNWATLGAVYYDQNCAGCVKRMNKPLTRDEWLTSLEEINEAVAHRPSGLSMEQEPVAWMGLAQSNQDESLAFDKKDLEEYAFITPLYTAPPRREWVGLTDAEAWEEWVKAVDSSNHSDRLLAFRYLRAIEAKLREKNT